MAPLIQGLIGLVAMGAALALVALQFVWVKPALTRDVTVLPVFSPEVGLRWTTPSGEVRIWFGGNAIWARPFCEEYLAAVTELADENTTYCDHTGRLV